jgi:hypothetical protein
VAATREVAVGAAGERTPAEGPQPETIRLAIRTIPLHIRRTSYPDAVPLNRVD